MWVGLLGAPTADKMEHEMVARMVGCSVGMTERKTVVERVDTKAVQLAVKWDGTKVLSPAGKLANTMVEKRAAWLAVLKVAMMEHHLVDKLVVK